MVVRTAVTVTDEPGVVSACFERIAASARLSAPAELVHQLGSGLPRRIAQRGRDLLGQPLHPLLTDLPIGFWTSAWVLDFIPGRAYTKASRTLLALGILSAVPAAISGLGDASEFDEGGRRLAAVHGTLNLAATAAFAQSWWQRRGSHRLAGFTSMQVGTVLATVAGMAGGHLAFGER
jgi:uncharacterized membrane protein